MLGCTMRGEKTLGGGSETGSEMVGESETRFMSPAAMRKEGARWREEGARWVQASRGCTVAIRPEGAQWAWAGEVRRAGPRCKAAMKVARRGWPTVPAQLGGPTYYGHTYYGAPSQPSSVASV